MASSLLRVALLLFTFLFRNSVGQIACSPPGESINATSGHISSPNFPNNYDANRICTWNITVPSGKIIKLTFLNFTLVAGENDDCAGAAADSARVFITNVASHGGNPNDFRICSQKLPPPVYSEGNFIQVRFESRTGPVNKGFNATFEAIDGDLLCPTDMILNETSGSFSSPFNPRNYPFNQTCSWKIIGKQGYRVELTIPDYNLERCAGTACSCDYMEVQNSFSDEVLPGKLCGTPRYIPVKFYSLHESLRVLFVSDDTNMDYDGFGATYKLLNYSPPICPKEAIPLSGSGKISSTNYPKSNYTASRNCTWNITAPADKIVKFTFTDFVLSECSANHCSDSCSYVELYDGGSTSSPLLGRFCQGSSWNETQLSSGNQMFVMFHPGQTVDRGFEAKYESTTTGVILHWLYDASSAYGMVSLHCTTSSEPLLNFGFLINWSSATNSNIPYSCYTMKSPECNAVGPLTWNTELAEGARNWSQFLLQNRSLLHEVDVLDSKNLGENLGFVFTAPSQPICSNSRQTSCVLCSQIVTEWYNEISNYNFDTGAPINSSEPWLHFTQLIWRSTSELGMAVASSDGYHYFVARYNPRGNTRGRFTRNVPRLRPTEPPTTTALPSTTTGNPNSTSVPLPTTPACSLPNRRTPNQEEINNTISIVILNVTLQEWCRREDEFRLLLANFVTDFCNAQMGICANRSLPSDVDLINILPGFPVVNSPLELRFYVRLKAGVNQHVTIDREVLYAIFENFAQNISEVLGVEFIADGNFTNWGPWGQCSTSCGPGTQIRFRNCTNPPPINNGQDCEGPRNETRPCNLTSCPVNGNFSEWENWSACSLTCGRGVQIRYRSCTDPPPSHGGRDCIGSRMETRECELTFCVVDGNFTEWSPWTSCSLTCGNGTQSRYRNCTNPPPQNGGRDCEGPRNETRDCFDGPCPVDGNFTEWGDWGRCSKTCGNGTQIRVRNCTNPSPAYGGQDCMGPRNESRECYEVPCPVDGNYTEWTIWGPCNETCGNGSQTRYRSCINPPPSNGGRDCVGPSNETRDCFIEPCAPRLYPYGSLVGDTKLPSFNLFGSVCQQLNIPGQGLPFFVKQHNKVAICRNGLLRFITRTVIMWPERFPGIRASGSNRFQRYFILAPFWSSISHYPFQISDTSQASQLFYQIYSKNILGDVSSNHAREIFDRVNKDVQKYQTSPSIPNFNASWVLKVTWERLYPSTYPTVNLTNTFQLVLATDGQHSFTLYNYAENGIQWASSTGSRFFSQNQSGLPVMGYNAGDQGNLRFFNIPGSGTVEADMVDERLGNTNQRGVWFFRLDVNPVLDLPAKKCYTWIQQQANIQVPAVRPCPCTLDQAVADKNFFVDYNQKIAGRSNLTTCAYSVPSPTSRWAQQCCYTEIPGSGYVLTIGPTEGGTPFLIGIPGFPIITDLEAHGYCCDASLCARYYELRPSDTCSRYSSRREALIWGDPHFVTLDNKIYTFNGLGEYTMITIDNVGFELQARTKKTSGRGLGTVFSAAAAKEANTAVVEGRINSRGDLEVFAAGNQQNIQAISEFGTLIQDSNITLIRGTSDSVSAVFPSGISITFSRVSDALATTFNGPVRFVNRTKGLLGTWNDDPSDDFTTPYGTVLSADATPQQIHYDFGLKWQINASQSLFTYQAHESPATFIDLSYVPMFIDNITWTNDSFRRQAESVCGNNILCLFDAAVTVNCSFGMSTKKLEENNIQANNRLETFPPQIDGPQVINATLNETVELNITARHNISDSFVFTVKFFPDMEVVSNTSLGLVVRWRPTSVKKVEPVFIVTDSSNSSSELRPLIRLCPCQNGGNCVEDDDVQRQLNSGVRFIVLSCACPAGLTGKFCESDVDACVEFNDPCFPGVVCTNVPLSIDKNGYTCGPCPSGYHGDGAYCIDNDECVDHVSRCSQSCINTPGSYVCKCYPGYTLDKDGVSCNDINECMEANDCMQRCTNYPGGRNCSCFEGFQIDQADNTACIPMASCNVSKAGCQQVCVEEQGQPKCSCHKGYQLKEDNQTCTDIDECSTHRHRCSQNCHNNVGSYTCSCDAGYNLDSDYMTCSDIDECGLIDVVYCANSLELCINTIGSFYCECQQGYQRVNNTCREIYLTTGEPLFTESPATKPSTTDRVPEDASNNAVVMTIRNTDISEWEDGISQLFEDIVAQVVVEYCQENENENCLHSKLSKRSITTEILATTVHVLKHYPQQEQADLVIAFYVILHSKNQESYLMTQAALLQALKTSSARLSARINKEVYNIRAFDADEASPPARESRIIASHMKWIIIGGASLAAIVFVIIGSVVACRRRRASRQLNKRERKSEFILQQWAGSHEGTVFGLPNQVTEL